MLITIIFSLVTACAALSLAAELRRDLMMMQQNSYRIERYRRWLRTSGRHDRGSGRARGIRHRPDRDDPDWGFRPRQHMVSFHPPI